MQPIHAPPPLRLRRTILSTVPKFLRILPPPASGNGSSHTSKITKGGATEVETALDWVLGLDSLLNPAIALTGLESVIRIFHLTGSI